MSRKRGVGATDEPPAKKQPRISKAWTEDEDKIICGYVKGLDGKKPVWTEVEPLLEHRNAKQIAHGAVKRGVSTPLSSVSSISVGTRHHDEY